MLLIPKEPDQLMELTQIENLLKKHLTDATEIHIQGENSHFGVIVVSDTLAALSRVKQQQAGYYNLFNLRRRKQPIQSAANFQNLFLIAALGARGLTSAPLLGETLASIIYDEPLPISEAILHNLSANRAWVRKWLKGSKVK